jgi:uncharacterized protein YraI
MDQRRFLICVTVLAIIVIAHGIGVSANHPVNHQKMFSSDEKKYGIVTATALNIRSEPSTAGSVVTKAVKGARVEVMSEKGDWIKVTTRDGKQGWCLKRYLSITTEKKEAAVTKKDNQQPTVKPTTTIKEQPKTVEPRSQATSHAAPPTYGVIAGIALAQLSGKNSTDNLSMRFGFTAGALAFFRLKNNFGFQPEILYAMKGAVKKSGDSESTVHLDYIDLPLLFRMTLPTGKNLSPYLTIGPVLSYNLQAIVMQSGSNSVQEITDVKKLDYGISVGGGVQFAISQRTFIAEARYYLGLAKIHDTKTDPLDLKNNCLTITLGWLLLP